MNSPDTLFLNGRWTPGEGEPLRSRNPATGKIVHDGCAASSGQAEAAVRAARAAFGGWSERSAPERADFLRAFAEELGREQEALADTISAKPANPVGKRGRRWTR